VAVAEETNGREVMDGDRDGDEDEAEQAEDEEIAEIAGVAEDKDEVIAANRVRMTIWIKLKSLECALMALCVSQCKDAVTEN
jgi:hypothetical protein